MMVFSTVVKNTQLLFKKIKKTKFVFHLLLVVVSLGIIGGLAYYFKIYKAQASGWWNDSFKYRKSIPITNSGSAQTDFQVAVTVDTATLISDGKMQSDCDDIRMISDSSELSYWIEEGSGPCNNASTVIWVKIPTIDVGTNTIYIYYGNSSATAKSSGSSVFPFFDDFNGGDINPDVWTATGAYTVSGGALTITTGAVYTDNTIVTTGQNYMYERRSQWTTTSGNYSGMMIADDQDTGGGNSQSDQLIYLMTEPAADLDVTGWAATGIGASYNVVDAASAQYTAVVSTYHINGFSMDTSNIRFFNNRTQINSYTGTWTQAPYLWLGYFSGSTSTTTDIKDMTTDWVLARKYAATAPSVGAFGSEELSPAPVAYWKMDEGYGTTTSDSSGNTNTATFGTGTSAPSWQTDDLCINGKCLKFDGSNDYISASSAPVINFTEGSSFTVSAWVKLTRTGVAQTILTKQENVTNEFVFNLNISSSDKAQFDVSKQNVAPATATGTTSLERGKWYFLTGTYDGSNTYIYVNGIQEGSTAEAFSAATQNVASLSIGRAYNNTGFFNGFIDDVKIYPYLRTDTQIKQDYNSPGSVKGTSAELGGPSTAGKTLSNGLVGYWKMDESSWAGAGAIIDSSGNLNSGSATNNATVTVGKFGQGGTFDGTNDNVIVTDNASLEPSNLTVSTWVKPTTTNSDAIYVVKRYASSTDPYNSYILYQTGSLYRFCISDGTVGSQTCLDSTSAVTTNWAHVTGTYDGTTMILYVNGIEEARSSPGITIGYSSLNLQFGEWGNGFDYHGLLDEVRIYNRTLSSREVTQIYQFAPGPIGYWKFDEKTGTTTQDNSGSGITGTLGTGNSAPSWTTGKYSGALSFDGSSDVVTTSSSTSLVTGALTMSGWVYFNSEKNYEGVFGKFNDCAGSPTIAYDFCIGTGAGGVIWANATDTAGSSVAQAVLTESYAGQWMYLTMTWDGVSRVSLYKNGIYRSSGTAPLTLSTKLPVQFGSPAGRNIDGMIDEVTLYNYVRTPAQIVQDMNAGHPAPGSPIGSAIMQLKFDEGYGDTVNNSGNQGTTLNGNLAGSCPGATGCPTWTNSGKYAKALVFDGTDDSLTVADTTALDVTNALTLSAWVNSDTMSNDGGATYRVILSKNDNTYTGSTTAYNLVYDEVNRAFRLDIGNGTTRVSLTSAYEPDNTWHHLVGTYDGTTVSLYVDGVLITSDSTTLASSSILVNTSDLFIGDDSGARGFHGTIDEVKIYDAAMTADQVKVEYNQGKSQVLGFLSTESDGGTPSNSSSREYCVPGDTSTCNPPVGEWKFDENTGTTSVFDTSGNNNTASMNGSMTTTDWVPGKIGSALEFDNANDYLDAGTQPSLSLGGTAVTVTAWINPSSISGNDVIASKGIFSGASNKSYMLFRLASNIYGEITTGTGVTHTATGATTLTANKWQHAAIVYNGSQMALYLNGVQDSLNVGVTGNLVANTSPFFMGVRSGGAEFFGGKMDDVKVYDYARTPAQIAWDYNKGAPAAWYKFDEGSGSTTYNSAITGNGEAVGYNGAFATGSSAPTWTSSGRFNGALDFDGTNDYISITDGNSSPLDFTTQMSMMAWVKLDDVSGWDIFIEKGEPDEYEFYLRAVTDKFAAEIGNGICDGNTAPVVDTWYHVAAVWDGSFIYMYLNGKLDNTCARSYTMTPDNTDLVIGKNPDTNDDYYGGLLDDVRLYNYALTETQVKIIYNNGVLNYQ